MAEKVLAGVDVKLPLLKLNRRTWCLKTGALSSFYASFSHFLKVAGKMQLRG